jgi:ubiquinone/menaquinone biosynthesis C-methylase UbiE
MQVAHLFRDAKKIAFNVQEEGELTVREEIQFDTKGLQNTHFIQCDAHNLPRVTVDADGEPLDCSHFNLIVCANLIDRLRSPKDVLHYLASVQKKGDWLFLLSPYTWMEEWTEKKNWIGGFYKDGDHSMPVTTFDGLKSELDATYELITSSDVPFLLREHARKFQYSTSHFTAWRRK